MRKELRLEWRNRAELEDNPKNWRQHPNGQLLALRDIIAEVGWAGALLFNERTGRLIDGHARKKIARKGEKIPVLVGSWTEEEERKILLTLDPIGSMAAADRTTLDELIASVRFESSALRTVLVQLAGETAWQSIGPPELKEPADNLELADELKEKWKTAEGQLWQVGNHRIICGDCRDGALLNWLWARSPYRLRLVWTDAPYGVSYGAKTAWMQKHGAQRKRAPIENDSLPPLEIRKLLGSALKAATKYAAPGASLYVTVPSGSLLPHFIAGLEDGGFSFKHSLAWIKNSMVLGRGDYHYRHETILYGWLPNGAHYFTADRSQDSVFEIDRPQANPFHPTTKPIELVARMIMNSSQKRELVFDPFCGSGTTLLACEQLGRIGFAVELDPRYVAVTLERLSALGLKPKLIRTFTHPIAQKE
jgi:DNA modification methylase